jgi:hypothetical protein
MEMTSLQAPAFRAFAGALAYLLTVVLVSYAVTPFAGVEIGGAPLWTIYCNNAAVLAIAVLLGWAWRSSDRWWEYVALALTSSAVVGWFLWSHAPLVAGLVFEHGPFMALVGLLPHAPLELASFAYAAQRPAAWKSCVGALLLSGAIEHWLTPLWSGLLF